MTTARGLTTASARVTRPRGRRLSVLLLVVAVLAVGAVVVVVVTRSPSHASTTASMTSSPASPAAQAYQQQINGALSQVATDLTTLVQSDQAWAAGTSTTADMAATTESMIPEFIAASASVNAVPPFVGAPQASNLFTEATRLDLEFVRVEAAATVVGPSPIRDQLREAAVRIRMLADRVFDRGSAAVDPDTFTTNNPNVVEEFPVEVPDWVAEGMAPGPPLAAPPGPAARVPPSRQDVRPSQSTAAWLAAVRRVGLPSAAAVSADITAGNPVVLGQIADQLTAMSAHVWSLADPAGDRERSATLGLAILVEAEAARMAEAAAVLAPVAPTPVNSPAPALHQTAERLALIADDLWDPALGAHNSGFDPSLLP